MGKVIFLINGLKRSGKDYLSDQIIELLGGEKFMFVEVMKSITCRAFGITMTEMDDLKNSNASIEEIMHVSMYGGASIMLSKFIILNKFIKAMDEEFGDHPLWKNLPDNARSDLFEVAINKNFESLTMRSWLQNFGTEACYPLFGDSIWAELAVQKVLSTNPDIAIFSDLRFPSDYKEINQKMRDTYKIITIKVIDNNLPQTDLHISETAMNGFDFDYLYDNTMKDGAEKVNSFIIENLQKYTK